ncbi:MAG: hypothetical protein QGI49_03240 [SAR202 cluster bacterium]|nr:hypothetical protein [SAR202 cluster bacterium]
MADRSNGRVRVYDADGKWLRIFGEDFLANFRGFVAYGDTLVIVELNARMAICMSRSG